MGLESATFIHQLNPINPVGAVDPKSQGDDHLRLIKSTLQATFPNLTGAMTQTQAALNALPAITGFAAPTFDVDLAAPTAGAATTVLRSDAKFRLAVGISPVWTGNHIFNPATAQKFVIRAAGATGNCYHAYQRADTTRKGYTGYGNAGDDTFYIANEENGPIVFQANAATRLTINVGDLTASVKYLNINGSAAAPAYGFASSPNCGMYSGAANTISFSCSSAVKFAIDAAALTFGASVVIKGQDGAAVNPFYAFESEPATGFYKTASADVSFSANNSRVVRFCSAANGGMQVADSTGALQTVGYRQVPRSTTATTLAAADVGKCVAITAAINIPASVFSAGDAITIYNDSAGALNLTISAGTLRLAGTAATGTRSIAARGLCTIWFNAGGATPEVIASGNVS